MFISAENCTEFIITWQIKMYIPTFVRFQTKPQRGARFGNIRESASHHVSFSHLLCHSHFVCEWGVHRSPAQTQDSCNKICVNLYVCYMPNSSRCIVEAIFYRKYNFSMFLICHLKISNKLFCVISMFISAENCTEFIITCQSKMYILTFIRLQMIFFAILKK